MAPDFFGSLISSHHCRRILEVGSGANPTLSPEYVRSAGISYVTSDANPEELEKADPAFERLVLNLSDGTIDPALLGRFDCVLSRMVGEHVKDGRQYYRNIFQLLGRGGISVHCFSTLWALPFVVNRLLPESLTDRLLDTFDPRNDKRQHGKFRAYYSWSRGPTKGMIESLRALGFEVVCWTGYFGHRYYQPRLLALHRLEMLKANFLLRHPVPQLCSYSSLVLRKP